MHPDIVPSPKATISCAPAQWDFNVYAIYIMAQCPMYSVHTCNPTPPYTMDDALREGWAAMPTMGALRSTRSCNPCLSAVGLLPSGMYAMRTLAARC